MQYASYPSLRGKRTVITGGGSGIGAAIVEAFAGQGAQVFFLDIAEEESKDLEKRLATLPTAPKFFKCDLKETNAIQAIFAGIADKHGPIEILVNNAASDDRHDAEKVSSEYWDDRIAVNLKHQFFCAQAVIPGMKAAGGGAIINLGSVSWHVAEPNMPIYQTTKAAIEGMTRAMSRDYGPFNIRITCLIPGAVKTPRQMRLWHTPEIEKWILDRQMLKFRVESEDIAAMALFLASDNARACIGHNFFVDAGFL